MSTKNLATYLNDHLAGSTVALDLVDHLIAAPSQLDHQRFFLDLRTEIEADQAVLKSVLAHCAEAESKVRMAAGWLAGKAGWAKMQFDGSADGAFTRLQALEGLALGITGKRALWQTLAAIHIPVAGADFAALTRRAEQQHDRVEARRLEAAQIAFAKGPDDAHSS